MALASITDIQGPTMLDALQVGRDGAGIANIKTGTVSIDPPSIGATTRGSQTFSLTGAAVGDAIMLSPPTALNAGLIYVGAAVTSANTVTVYIYNTTAGAIDDGANNWTYLWLHFGP